MNKCIIASSIFYKYSSDIFNELSVISLLRHFKEDSQYILIDGNGTPQYTSDPKLDVDIVRTREVQSVIT